MKAGAISLDFSRAVLHQCSEMATFLKSFSRPQCRPHTQRPNWASPLPIVPPAPSPDQGAPALFHARSNHLPISGSTDEATPGPGTATRHAGCSHLLSTRLCQNNSSPLWNHSGKGTMGGKAHGHLLMHPKPDKWHLSLASLELARDCTALEHKPSGEQQEGCIHPTDCGGAGLTGCWTSTRTPGWAGEQLRTTRPPPLLRNPPSAPTGTCSTLELHRSQALYHNQELFQKYSLKV